MIQPGELYKSPNALAPEYSRFRVGDRLLFTGHSHQAWPDCGFAAQQQAWTDAAELVDAKWDQAFARADAVRRGYARLLGDEDGFIALGQNTHELVVRLLSALPLRNRPRIVTTDGEFHTIRRQLDRLSEEGIEIVKVHTSPASAIAERLCDAVNGQTAIVMVSAVLYQNAHVVPGLDGVMAACEKAGAALLVDAYHALNVIPFSLVAQGITRAFVIGGGYKYCQLGEGSCFLRFPRDTELRPVITGWYSEFDAIAEAKDDRVVYGQGASRFAGATYDPTSHYRAAEVFSFFERNGLSPDVLRKVSQHQVMRLADGFDALDLDPRTISRDRTLSLRHVGGFLALDSPRAEEISTRLRDNGLSTDFRADTLRLGPAPYVSDEQIDDAMQRLGVVCRALN